MAPLRLSLSPLPCKTSLQSDLPAVSGIDLQTHKHGLVAVGKIHGKIVDAVLDATGLHIKP